MKLSFNNLTVFISLLVVSVVIYFPSIYAGFLLYDDPEYITENYLLRDFSGKGFITLFTQKAYDLYIPLTWLSYWIEQSMFGFSSKGMHLTNIVLHTLNAFLLFKILLKLFNKAVPAFLTALLFLVHPLHVESVAWLSERKDVLYAFFYLLAFIFYIDFKSTQNKRKYYLSFLFFILSCLSKPMAVSFSVVLIATDYFIYNERTIKQHLNKIPFLAVSVLFSLIAVKLMDTDSLQSEIGQYSLFEKMALPFYEMGFYTGKLILPLNLCAIYAMPDSNTEIYLYALFFIILSGIAFLRGNKYVRFSLSVYVVVLLPVLQLIPNANALVVDRYMYLSSIMLFAIICFGAEKSVFFQKNTKIIFAGMVLLLGVLSYNRCKIWVNDITLFTDVISKNKKSYTAYANLGMYYLKQNNSDKALVNLKQAVDLKPDNAVILTNYAWALAITNQTDQALKILLKSADITPLYFKTWNNLGVVLGIKRQYKLSLKSLLLARKLNSHNAELYYNLAITYSNLAQPDIAVDCYRQAAKMGLTQAQQFLSAHNLGW
jgi:Tfp pilus assembly protein PilF